MCSRLKLPVMDLSLGENCHGRDGFEYESTICAGVLICSSPLEFFKNIILNIMLLQKIATCNLDHL